jgi:hypothetical protein
MIGRDSPPRLIASASPVDSPIENHTATRRRHRSPLICLGNSGLPNRDEFERT